MGLKPKFNANALRNYLNDNVEQIRKNIIRRMRYIGEKLIIEARENKGYKDVTSNLKNSIGYVIVYNKEILYTSNALDANSEGEAKKKKLLTTLMADIPDNHIALIMVAGMEYALYVEAMGYNVLTSAEGMAEKEIKSTLKRLANNLNKKMSNE